MELSCAALNAIFLDVWRMSFTISNKILNAQIFKECAPDCPLRMIPCTTAPRSSYITLSPPSHMPTCLLFADRIFSHIVERQCLSYSRFSLSQDLNLIFVFVCPRWRIPGKHIYLMVPSQMFIMRSSPLIHFLLRHWTTPSHRNFCFICTL